MKLILIGCLTALSLQTVHAIHSNPFQPQEKRSLLGGIPKPVQESTSFSILSFDQVNEELWGQFVDEHLGDVAIECPSGHLFPLFIQFNSQMLSLEGESCIPMQLKVEQTFYLRKVKGVFLFSLDTIQWESFTNFFRGVLNTDLYQTSRGEEICLEFDLER